MTTDQWGCKQSEGIVDVWVGIMRLQRWIQVWNEWKISNSLEVPTSIIDDWEQFLEHGKKWIKGF